MQPQESDTPVLLDQPSKFSRLMNRLYFFKHWSKKKKLIFSAVSLLIIGAGVFFILSKHSNNVTTLAQNINNVPTTVASPLTGVQVSPALAARPVTNVMIENSTDARPQSGLQAAGVVFEAVAEGGITRFAALFQEATPQYIGPVRSVRPYFLDWAAGFQASIAHVGGSPDALRQVRSGMRDLDEFFNAGSYWRIASRYAPHNVYTSFAKLDALNKSKGYKKSTFTSWPRKADSALAIPTAKTIKLSLSGYDYDVSYSYDKKSNTYFRSEGGAPHMELSASGKLVQIHPKVVIAIVVQLGQGALDATGAYYSNYHDTGKGIAYVFQDSGVIKGTWIKKSINGQISFVDALGKPIALNAGQTWLTAVSASSAISYNAK